MPQGKHIRAPKHYSEPQGVWVAQKSTFYRIPEGFPLQNGSYHLLPVGPRVDLHQKSKIFDFCILLTRMMSFDDFYMKKTILKV